MAIKQVRLLITIIAFAVLAFALPGQNFTGEVSDAMCGAEHMMKGSKADCARACAAKGANYALVVGDKVYTLETSDKAILDKLNTLAGQHARVVGKANGDSIVVSAVSPSK